MKRSFGGILLIVFFLTACSVFAPRFVNHKQPDVRLDFKVFENAGCPPNKYGFRICAKDSPLYAMGCDRIEEPSNLLGALIPAYPIVLCITNRDTVLFDEIIPIEGSLQEKCGTSPDKVCLENEEVISETVKGNCARTHSTVCDTYRQVLQEKCNSAPTKVCEPIEGPYQIRMEVEDKVLSVDPVAIGNYTYKPEGSYFFRDGGLMPVLFRYVIFQDNHFVLLETEDKFREIFAPLETADEALAYVKATTGLRDLYDLKPDAKYEYFVDVIEDTHVDKAADGYLVYLYSEDVFGCGPHPTSSVVFHVTPEGNIQQQEVKQVFKNPTEDHMCVD